MIAMGSLTAALTSGRTGWTSATTVVLMVVAVAGLGVFVRLERRHPAPLLDLTLLRRPLFVTSVGGAAVSGLASVALMSYAPTMLERGMGDSPLVAGLILLAWSVPSMLTSMQARRLPARFHSRGRLVAGLSAGGVGTAALAWLGTASPWWTLVPGLVVSGVGSGLGNAALARLAVESVPAGNAALGSGATNTARYLGSALGIALTVAIVAAGGSGRAGMIEGWNRAALAATVLDLVGAALAISAGWRTAIRQAAATPAPGIGCTDN
jgi:Na+/melibiose symporter-like transporter